MATVKLYTKTLENALKDTPDYPEDNETVEQYLPRYVEELRERLEAEGHTLEEVEGVDSMHSEVVEGNPDAENMGADADDARHVLEMFGDFWRWFN